MTGESHRDDTDDFLDDDFVIEDIVPKNEDLEQLFEMPDGPAAKAKPADPDAEDMLFTAPEADGASETFSSGPEFAESAASSWDGGSLDLEAEAAAAERAGRPPEEMAAAEASFTKELDSLLQSEEDFALDSEQELEVIGGAVAGSDGVSEFEQSGPFVLDDGEGVWQESDTAEAAAAESEDYAAPLQASAQDADANEPGWEPLPSATVDELSEVDEVARAEQDEYDGYGAETESGDEYEPSYDEGAYGEDDAETVGAGVDVEGHDLYVEDRAAAVLGPQRPRRGLRVVMPLLAASTLLAAGALVVLRPEWIGLRLEPEHLQQAEVSRPVVAVEVPAPPELAPAVVEQPAPAVVVTEPPAVEPAPVDPVAVAPVEPQPVEPQPVEAPTAPVEPGPVASTPSDGDPTTPPVVAAPTPGLPGWPSMPAAPDAPRDRIASADPTRLVRVSEELMIGEPAEMGGSRAAPVIPGSRAFAQLQNGNYFIGNVKSADAQHITLRIDNGEVTIPVAAIARLTELGSADYEELQKVTSGFVRLTNNNRLVGGILSGIADDHVVLEFRRNRVMLPKALVGAVVQGKDDAGIRIDTTREEDAWLERLVERQLGTGTGAEPPAAPPDGKSQR